MTLMVKDEKVTKSFSSKQARKISLTLSMLAVASISANPIQASASWDIEPTYREGAGLGRYLEYPFYGNTTPHDVLTEHDGVTFASTPAPYVSAVSTIYIPSVSAGEPRSGRLSYTFDISGAPASSYVPVSFQGIYSMARYNLSPSATALVEFSVTSAVWNEDYSRYQNVHFEDSCFDYSCDGHLQLKSDTLSFIRSTVNEENTEGVAGGKFSGIINLQTNEFGEARGAIDILAYAFAGYYGTQSVEAFIDPYLQIDPSWLIANPGATLVLPQGVGNQPSAVPVPAAAWLFGSSLLGLFGLKRQRRV
jgi:hypothetical protein